MKPGLFLKSTSLLNDTFFENALLFITEYNEKGAMGFVVNQPYPRKLNELEEFKNSAPFPIYQGGPVSPEHLFFIHQRPDLIEEGQPVTGNIFLGGNFKSAVRHLDDHTLTENDCKMFIGYCGWDFGDLDEEIAEGSWELADTRNLFSIHL
jgi:putative transcriptional regulator